MPSVGIRTHNPSKRAAANVLFRPRGLLCRRTAVCIVIKHITVIIDYCDMKYVSFTVRESKILNDTCSIVVSCISLTIKA
jgi:hypothetical protein